MNNENIIEDFFRSFRVTLTNAFSYPKDHPYFIKSVENFKLKLQDAQSFLIPFKIGVADLGLLVGGENLTRKGFYDELARLLHQRKIKSIEIKSGATLEEIVSFFSVISMAPKDILKGGGVNVLLEKKDLVNFIIEELDYSAFLQENGQECSDVWGYMLKEAVLSKDQTKLNNLAENFSVLIKRTDQKDILETEEIPSHLNEFLVSLKDKNKEQFDKCSKDIFLWLLRNKKSIDEEKLKKLKLIFNSLNPEDLNNLFLEGIYQDDNFDALSLELFSKISQQKDLSEVAEGPLNKVSLAGRFNNNPRAVKRIKDLLLTTQSDQLSAVYRNTLESLIKDISLAGELSFDQKALKENYRYIVLNIFDFDKDEENLLLAAENLEKELDIVIQDNDLDFLKDLWGVLVKHRGGNNHVYTEFEKKFSVFIESIILNQPLAEDREFFLEMVSFSSQDIGFYLERMFADEKISKPILSLFLKFFPGNLDIFYSRVKQRIQDIEFISSLIDALGQLAMPVTLGMLDNIYSLANELIKIEILNNMRKSKKMDAQFLLRQLNTDSPLLRKNLLSALILNAQTSDVALEILFKIPSFCGRNNELLIENMQIVFDLGLIEAAGYIHDFSRRRFFWNRELRDKAKQILKEWDVK